MGDKETSADTITYETKELAWELTQPRADRERVKFLLESGGDLRSALQTAQMEPQALAKHPTLRPLQLHKRL